MYALRLDRQNNITYINFKSYSSRLDAVYLTPEDENEQPIKEYCAEHIKVTRYFIIVSCPSYDNFRGIVYIYMRPGMYTKMNKVPWVGELILVKTFYGTH